MTDVKDFGALRDLLELPYTGLVETGLGFAAPLLRRVFPNLKMAVIRRPVAEVRHSLHKVGVDWITDLEERSEDLDRIEKMPGVLSLNFADLDTFEGARRLWRHCSDMPFDFAHWRSLASTNVQIDIPARVQKLIEFKPRYDALVDEINQLMGPVTFHVEQWSQVYPECQALFDEHAAEVGNLHPGMPFDPNIRLAEATDRAGNLLIVTARAGKKLVGYCFVLLTESFESQNVPCATQGIIFMSREFRHNMNGYRLLRETVAQLQARGVWMVYLRHGLRGASRKLGLLFKRLGAVDNGRDYALWIGPDAA